MADEEMFDWGDGTEACLLGREGEARVLQLAFNRVRSKRGNSEIILLHGQSGIGKTHLIKSVVEARCTTSDLYGSGKFGQAEDTRPFSAIIDAVTELLTKLNSNPKHKSVVETITRKMKPGELNILRESISTLGNYFPCDKADDDLAGRPCAITPEVPSDTGSIRFQNLFRRLLRSLASADHPIILFFDDCQWADSESRHLLESIVKDGKLHHILIIASVRDGETTTFTVDPDAKFVSQKLIIESLSVDAVVAILARALRVESNDLVELGKIVHKRCDGNPLFVKQYIELLRRDCLVWLNAETKKHEFDLNAISSAASIPMSVMELFVEHISTLPTKTRVMLICFSVCEYSISKETLESILANESLVAKGLLAMSVTYGSQDAEQPVTTEPVLSNEKFSETISNAKIAGLIEEVSPGRYKFVHDRIQQAAQSILREGDCRQEFLSNLGSHLHAASMTARAEDWMLFRATNLLIKNRDSSVATAYVSTLCLEAAKRASRQAGFQLAARIADAGIKILGETGWTEEYNLMLELFNVSAESHFSNCNNKMCLKRFATLKTHTKQLRDTFRCLSVHIWSLSIMSDYKGCLDEATKLMGQMRIRSPRNPSIVRVMYNNVRINRMLRGRTPSEVTGSLEHCSDTHVEYLVKILHPAIVSAYYTGDEFLLLNLALVGMELTIKHGLCSGTPFILQAYGNFVTVLGKTEEGFEYGHLGREIARKLNVAFCHIQGSYNLFFSHLKFPMKDTYKSWKNLKRQAIQDGEAYSIGQSAQLSTTMGIVCGTSLWDLREECDHSWDLLGEFKQQGFGTLLGPYYSTILTMMDSNHDSGSISSRIYDDDGVLSQLRRKGKLDRQAHALVLAADKCRTMMLYLNGDYEENAVYEQRHAKILKEPAGEFSKSIHNVFLALNYLALARENKIRFKIRKLNRYIQEITKYDVFGSINFVPWMSLIEAERMSVTLDVEIDEIKAQYDKAIGQLKDGEFHMLACKATERLGDFLLVNAKRKEAVRVLQDAWSMFAEKGFLFMGASINRRYCDQVGYDFIHDLCHNV